MISIKKKGILSIIKFKFFVYHIDIAYKRIFFKFPLTRPSDSLFRRHYVSTDVLVLELVLKWNSSNIIYSRNFIINSLLNYSTKEFHKNKA